MSDTATWAKLLHLTGDCKALQASVLHHIRDSVREAGYVSRGRITSGIKEAFRPLGLEEERLRGAIDEAISLLMRTGDIDELSTGAGRGYAPTPPRRITWGGTDDVLLGSVPVSSNDTVRRAPAQAANLDAVRTSLQVELGRPAWRDMLVMLGSADQPDSDPTALSAYAETLTRSGERYSLDEPNALAVLSENGEFFGSPDDLSGRWARATANGFYAAAITSGYTRRRALLAIDNGTATLWEPPSRDVWHWIIVGITLAQGGQARRYNRATETLDFLTPPPRQAERAALLTGEQLSAWSWRVDAQAEPIIARLLGFAHS